MKVSPLSRWFYYALGLFSIAFVFQVLSQRYLFADGANFFLQVTTTQTFSHWDFPRQFAHYLTQWPIVLGIKLGMRNLAVLSTLYGIGLFMWPLAALLVCNWFTPDNQKALLVFPVFAFAYTGLNSALFIISESHAAAACFWVILFYLFFTPRTWGKQATVLAFAVAATRMYESYAFLGLVLAGFALVQAARSVMFKGPVRELGVLLAIAATMVVGSAIGIYFMVVPTDRNVGTVGLSNIILGLLQDPNVWISSALMLFFLSTFFPNKHQPRDLRTLSALLWIAIGGGSFLGMLTLASRAFVPVLQQYPARVLNIAVPMLFAGVMLYLRNQGPRRPMPTRWSLIPLFAMLFWNTTWQTTVSGQWQAYADSVQHVVEGRQGLVDLDTTVLAAQPFNWDWSMPSLSIVVDAFKEKSVPALVTPSEKPRWEPFDPSKPQDLPNLQAYGITYRWVKE